MEKVLTEKQAKKLSEMYKTVQNILNELEEIRPAGGFKTLIKNKTAHEEAKEFFHIWEISEICSKIEAVEKMMTLHKLYERAIKEIQESK